MSSSAEEDEYEYDYSDEEVGDDDSGMDWNPSAIASENPNAAPTMMYGKQLLLLILTSYFFWYCRHVAIASIGPSFSLCRSHASL